MAVPGHDESRGANLRQIGRNTAGTELQLCTPLQRQPLSQGSHTPALLSVVVGGHGMQDTRMLTLGSDSFKFGRSRTPVRKFPQQFYRIEPKSP